jgi:hypothetical protein
MMTLRRNCAISEEVWNVIRDVLTTNFQQSLELSDGSINVLNNILRLSQFMVAGVVPEESEAVDMFLLGLCF